MTDTTAASPQALADQGRAALANGDFERANERFDTALKALGDSYASSDTLDDTGMQLIAANDAAKKGNLEAAAKQKARILDARLQMASRKPRG